MKPYRLLVLPLIICMFSALAAGWVLRNAGVVPSAPTSHLPTSHLPTSRSLTSHPPTTSQPAPVTPTASPLAAATTQQPVFQQPASPQQAASQPAASQQAHHHYETGMTLYRNATTSDSPAKAMQQAASQLQRAAASGHLPAIRQLLSMQDKNDLSLDAQTHYQYLRTLAESGDVNGQVLLSAHYLRGEHIAADAVKARYWAEQAAQNGHLYAMQVVAHYYRQGIGGQIDLAKAQEWQEKFTAAHGQDTAATPTRPPRRGAAFAVAAGLFVTHHHVVKSCDRLQGHSHNPRNALRFPLELVHVDARQQLAVLRSPDPAARLIPPVPFSMHDTLATGAKAYIAGFEAGVLEGREVTILRERAFLAPPSPPVLDTAEPNTPAPDTPLNDAAVKDAPAAPPPHPSSLTPIEVMVLQSAGAGYGGAAVVDGAGRVVGVVAPAEATGHPQGRYLLAAKPGALRAWLKPHITLYSSRDFTPPSAPAPAPEHQRRLLRATLEVVCQQ